MGKSPVATRQRRRSSKPVRTVPVFPAQRRAARNQAMKVTDKVAARMSRKASAQPPIRRLPRPAVWLLAFVGAAAASVLVGFLLGLARPRQRPEGQS